MTSEIDNIDTMGETIIPLGRDLVRPGLALLLCGINPGLSSAATGYPFANPGNRFWRTLHAARLTDRLLRPDEAAELLRYGIGLTRLVDRPTRRADELTAEELRAGGARLLAMAERHAPRAVAMLGVSAYRAAFGRPQAQFGRQADRLAEAELWVLPNPSGLNAHYTPAGLAAVYRECRDALFGGEP